MMSGVPPGGEVPSADTPDIPLTESELERRDLLRSRRRTKRSPWVPVLVAGGLIVVLGLVFTDIVVIALGAVFVGAAVIIGFGLPGRRLRRPDRRQPARGSSGAHQVWCRQQG